MKILLCTKNDLFGADILNWLLPRLAGHQLRVLLSDKTRAEENSIPDLVIEKVLERDVPLGQMFPMIDAQPLRGELLSFQGLAERYGVSIQKVYNINGDASENQIRDFAPDVIVSARFSLIFKANILRIARWGAYNIHPGALPGYGGLFAPMRGLLNGDARLGCTLHQINEGIDTGPVHSVAWLTANPALSVFAHLSDVYRLGLENLMLLLDDLARGMAPRLVQQDPAAFRYYGLPAADDFAHLRQRGIEPVSFPDYCRFVRRFWPAEMAGATPTFLDPVALARQITGG